MPAEKSVCSSHFTDHFIRSYIDQNCGHEYCDFCQGEKPAISIKDLADYVEQNILEEYGEPYEHGAPYNSDGAYYEDRFPGVVVHWRTDLIEGLVDCNDFGIIEALSDNFSNDYWAELDSILGPTKAEYLRGGWDAFKEILKHKIRFLFFDPNFEKSFEDEDHESSNPYLILNEVGKALVELNCFMEFQPKGLNVFRARQHEIHKFFDSAKELGPPPPDAAKANRMSPAGISMFYGAFDINTCASEVQNLEWKGSLLTVAEFTNVVPVKLIDFTNIGEIPSLFDVDNRHKRPILKFIKSFVQDLSIPVIPDERVHIEYIPTQVVTEFMKYKLGKANEIKGIMYNSVKNAGGRCVVLFIESENVVDSTNLANRTEEHTLMMISDTIVSTLVT